MQYSVTSGVVMAQVLYKLLHAVQCNWRFIDGSSDVQITHHYKTRQFSVTVRMLATGHSCNVC